MVAAWKGQNMTIAIMNPDNQSLELPLEIEGALFESGKLWRIANEDPSAFNEPGKPPQVVIEEIGLNNPENQSLDPELETVN